MLTVTIPVADTAKPRRVQIRTGRQVVEPAGHPDTVDAGVACRG